MKIIDILRKELIKQGQIVMVNSKICLPTTEGAAIE